jgi:hypothetical protein
MKMKKMIFLMVLSFLGITASMNAQVNIGSAGEPKPGALLDLSQSGQNLGLILPNVYLANMSDWQLDEGNGDNVSGLVVFNTNNDLVDATGAKIGKGIYVWSGSNWMAAKSGAGASLLWGFDLSPNGAQEMWENGTLPFTASGWEPNNELVAKSVKWAIPGNQSAIAAIQTGYTGTTCTVKGLTPGEATLVVTSLDGNAEQTVTITVKEVFLTSFDLDKTKMRFIIDGSPATLTASNFKGADDLAYPDQPVTWTTTGDLNGSLEEKTEKTYTVTPGNAETEWTITASSKDVTKTEVEIDVVDWPAALKLRNAARDYSTNAPGDVAKNWTTASNSEYSGTAYTTRPTVGVAPASGNKHLMVSQYAYAKNGAKVYSPNAGPAPETAAASWADLKAGSSWSYAVATCAGLTEGGFDDWYLPNAIELIALDAANLLGKGTPANENYDSSEWWSSTETGNKAQAWNRRTKRYNDWDPSGKSNESGTTLGGWQIIFRCVRRY